MNAARYELNVPATGADPSAPTWVAVEADTGSDAPVTVSDAEPGSPEVGDLWYYTGGDDEAGNEPGLYVRYNDGTTENWTSTTSMYTVPAAPTGPAEDTSYNLQVTSAGSASWEPVADSGGGSSGGGSAPTDSTFITSATPPGSSFEVLTLTAGAASTQFYINGGVEYQNASLGGDSGRRQSLWLTNPTGIVAGQFMLLSGGTPNASVEIWNSSFIYNNANDRFEGWPTSSTFDTTGQMRLGLGSSTFTTSDISGVSETAYALSHNSSNINVGILPGGTFSGSVTVTAGETVRFALVNFSPPGSNPGVARLTASQLT